MSTKKRPRAGSYFDPVVGASSGSTSATGRSGLTPLIERIALGSRSSTDRSLSESSESSRKRQRVNSPHDFVIPDHAVEENEDLVIVRETNDWEGDNEKPCRLLTDFTFFDANNGNALADLTALEEKEDSDVRGFGSVKPLFVDEEDDLDEEDDEDPDGVQLVMLSSIFRYTLEIDPHRPLICIQTSYAWYILDKPSPAYEGIFLAFWRPRYLARLAIYVSPSGKHVLQESSAIDGGENINQEELGGAVQLLGRRLRESEAMQSISESNDMVLDLLDDAPDDLVNELTSVPRELARELKRESTGSATPRRHRRPQRRSREAKRPNIETALLKNRNPTYATPFVRLYASALCFQLGQHQPDGGLDGIPDSERAKYITCDPATVVQESVTLQFNDVDEKAWKVADKIVCPEDDRPEILIKGEPRHVAMYGSVSVGPGDKDKLQVNNFVIIRGKDPGRAEELWFAQIVHIFRFQGVCYLHVKWFAHGCTTELREGAHSRELFATHLCDNVPINSVAGKVFVKQLYKEDPCEKRYTLSRRDHFFYRYLWDRSDHSFTAAPEPSTYGCDSCQYKAALRNQQEPQQLGRDGLKYLDGLYHELDFVYLAPLEPNMPFRVGQIRIIKWKGASARIDINIFGRFDDTALDDTANDSERKRKDPRRLYATRLIIRVMPESLRGPCVVEHTSRIGNLSDWCSRDDHFYVDSKCEGGDMTDYGKVLRSNLLELGASEIQQCSKCKRERIEDVASSYHPLSMLKAMDLFCGAGGLAQGMHLSGVVKTHWAIDFSPSAAKTFEENHSDATVYNQCANKLLERAIRHDKDPDVDLDSLCQLGNFLLPCPNLPQPGQIDLLFAGPPCQGFSRLNANRGSDDIRSSLLLLVLSYVDFYRPKYFLLENVASLLTIPTKTQGTGPNDEDRVVRKGVTKFILRTLLAMGYQVRYKVLQAIEYGTPQSRTRVFFWAARMDVSLPEFPRPTHTRPRLAIARSGNFNGAPQPYVSSEDAVGDLPLFHWQNPMESFPETTIPVPEGPFVNAVQHRGATVCTLDDPAGSAYPTDALTPYQAWCRGESRDVYQHYTRMYGSKVVERICNIPMNPGADHRLLPNQLQIWHLSSPHSRAAEHHYSPGKYGRVQSSEPSPTILTRMEPAGKQGRVLHYNQNRVLTAREAARFQGFPDCYTFYSDTGDITDIMRQIGNAVPVTVARCLGLALKACIEKDAERTRRSGSVPLG